MNSVNKPAQLSTIMGEKKPRDVDLSPFQVGCDEVLFHLGGCKYLILNKDHSDKFLPMHLGDKPLPRLRICDLSGDPTKTKKLIRLNLHQWISIVQQMGSINSIIKLEAEKEGSAIDGDDGTRRLSLGGNVYITFMKGRDGMDFRWFWLPHDNTVDLYVAPHEFNVRPSRYGIWLKNAEFHQLEKLVPIVKQLLPELEGMEYCWDGHDNQESQLQCHHCNPNGYIAWI